MLPKKVVGTKTLALAGLLALAGAGCASDRPRDYDVQRPPVGQLDPRDRGLQSKDVIQASDAVATDLLALPELRASDAQWLIVVDRMEDQTRDRTFRTNFDIFLERLRVNLAKQGRGTVRLIENKARFSDLRARELESERDDFGQGPGGRAPAPAARQPDYALYGKAIDMPNRGTNYYLLQFDLTDLRTREQVWTDAYEVKVAR